MPFGDRLEAGGVEEAHVVRAGEVDAALPAEIGEDAADGLGGQAEIVGDVGSRHRQVDAVGGGAETFGSRRRRFEEAGDALARGLAAMPGRAGEPAGDAAFRQPRRHPRILVTGTNVNTMIIPGYVSQVHTVFTKTGDLLMPCHEYCGLGHSQMWATVQVVPENEFKPDADGRATCDAR